MHKKACQGCGDTFVGRNQKELDKLLKLHWDYQNPSLAECDYCSISIHAKDDELVKKRFLEHEKFCEEAKQHHWKRLFACKNVTREDCNKFFLTTNNNKPNPKQLKKHLKEKHEIENAISCKFIMNSQTNCQYWFKCRLDEDGEQEFVENDENQHYKGLPHFIN